MTLAAPASYWDQKAAQQPAFNHPLEVTWIAGLPKDARILDYGCGYGRTLDQLRQAGWRNTLGVDFSGGMIERGRREHPELDLQRIDTVRLDAADGAFDLVLLFAVLTTIPGDADQRAVVNELGRLLKPGGLLYVSDYLLQDDARNLERYRAGEARHRVRGVWDREDGGVFRHQTEASLSALLSDFERLRERAVATTSLSGAGAVATQILAAQRAAC